MSVTPRYPGVYIEEIPSGARTITGVATSIAAFVDNFRRGPLNEAVRILSYADFEREFGGLEACSGASYAIRQFFLNGGSEAYVVRVGTTPLAAAAAVINAGGCFLPDLVHGDPCGKSGRGRVFVRKCAGRGPGG